MEQIIIAEHEAGQRLDRFLCGRLGISRGQARRLVDAGAVFRNKRPVEKHTPLEAGDQIEVRLAALDPTAQPDPSVSLLVRFEDAMLVVVDKPSGLACHPLEPGERGCLANGLVARYPEMGSFGYDSRQPGLVNRLDNATSGLVLAGRTPPVFAALRAALQRGDIHKKYLALTSRPVEVGAIDLPLTPKPKGPRVEVARDRSAGRPASTFVLSCRPLERSRFLVEVEALRAYRHQVRVHLAALGAPIVGDALYGGEFAAHHYLHASELRFVHPVTEEALRIESPLPDDWPAR